MNRRTFIVTSLCAPILLKSLDVLGELSPNPILINSPWYAPAGVIRGIQWIPCVQTQSQLNNVTERTNSYDKEDTIGCYVEDEEAAYIRIPYKQKYLFRTLTHTKWVQFSGKSI